MEIYNDGTRLLVTLIYQLFYWYTTVKVKFNAQTAPFIRERKWHPSQEIEEHQDGSLTLSLESSGLNNLKRWILGYGSGAVALEPPELVELVRNEIKKMTNCY
ncbi:WYL domain-containing protein [Cyanobacterium sp. Dongsha4]|uniref:WYL domain-containing protein n=1 Tax=Cyanobacterium sp. DS4 TaxID=2878255 RepID=UPI002E822E31|nr:WYL domain-containing protein [Cyanobacterium sp. Dongsha4]WVL00254.1 WYL domain-containing protein [Cyanobacterium sp. Dongsha4]